jgi:hypothetical protein
MRLLSCSIPVFVSAETGFDPLSKLIPFSRIIYIFIVSLISFFSRLLSRIGLTFSLKVSLPLLYGKRTEATGDLFTYSWPKATQGLAYFSLGTTTLSFYLRAI